MSVTLKAMTKTKTERPDLLEIAAMRVRWKEERAAGATGETFARWRVRVRAEVLDELRKVLDGDRRRWPDPQARSRQARAAQAPPCGLARANSFGPAIWRHARLDLSADFDPIKLGVFEAKLTELEGHGRSRLGLARRCGAAIFGQLRCFSQERALAPLMASHSTTSNASGLPLRGLTRSTYARAGLREISPRSGQRQM